MAACDRLLRDFVFDLIVRDGPAACRDGPAAAAPRVVDRFGRTVTSSCSSLNFVERVILSPMTQSLPLFFFFRIFLNSSETINYYF